MTITTVFEPEIHQNYIPCFFKLPSSQVMASHQLPKHSQACRYSLCVLQGCSFTQKTLQSGQ